MGGKSVNAREKHSHIQKNFILRSTEIATLMLDLRSSLMNENNPIYLVITIK